MMRGFEAAKWLPVLLGCFTSLMSCKKPDPIAKAEIARLKGDLEDFEKRHEDEIKLKSGELEGLKEENRALKSGLKQIDELRSRSEAAEKEARELRLQVEDLRKKSVQRERQKGVGETIAALELPDGRSYANVRIRAITDHSVSIQHQDGSATLGQERCPKDWVRRFSLIPVPAALPATVQASVTPGGGLPKTTVSLPTAAPTPSTPSTSAGSPPKLLSQSELNEVSKRNMSAVVMIKGDFSVGTGFFVNEDGLTYLYTAAHVLNGNSKLEIKSTSGQVFTKFGSFESADGKDLVRLGVNEEVPATVTVCAPGAIAIGKPLFAIGDSGGGDVLTVLSGAVTGVGTTEFEVDASIIQGNSGGPVFGSVDGKVMGVVTRGMAARTDVWAEGTRFGAVRRFACRVDGEIKWQAGTLSGFLGESRAINDLNRVTRLLYALSQLRAQTNGLRTSSSLGGNYTVLKILTENQDMEAVKSLVEMNTALASSKMKVSDRDLLKRYASYYQTILSAAQRQSGSFQPEQFSTFNREDARLCLKWRSTAEAEIKAVLESMGR